MTTDRKAPLAVRAVAVAPRTRPSIYPQPFAQRVEGRVKRQLGEVFGLSAFGVNLTTLAPGAASALLHRHSVQDEFVYVVEGDLVLVTDDGELKISAGMCAGFPARGLAHQLVNRSSHAATYLEIGDRASGDSAEYPDDDLVAIWEHDTWRFTHKDGSDYD